MEDQEASIKHKLLHSTHINQELCLIASNDKLDTVNGAVTCSVAPPHENVYRNLYWVASVRISS